MSFGALYEELFFEAQRRSNQFRIKRKTAATYLEFQTKYDKFNFILGGRAENYKITGKTKQQI